MQKELIVFFSEMLQKERFELFKKVADYRTNYITVVLEDLYQSHNASAVLRSCDCFGIQNVHIIENRNEYVINPDIAVGSTKWLSINRYNSQGNNTPEAIQYLKNQGYRIIATTPHINDVALNNFDLSQGKFALFFGSEKPGLSNFVMENADQFVRIPMFGFTESLNISVSAAICLQHLTAKLHSSNINWQLTDNERDEIILDWLRKAINRSDIIERCFLNRKFNG